MRHSGQDLEAGDGSTNLQVQGDVVVSAGVTPDEARAIANDVFRDNFLKLGADAADLAAGRAARLIDDFVDELKADFPDRLRAAADPDVQYALFQAQAGFARSGEEELAGTLRELLVERAGETTGTTRAIALNEAIEAAPRLTLSQRRAIAVCFFLRYTGWPGGLDLNQYYGALISGLASLAGPLPQNQSDYQHIASIGAGTELIGIEFGAALTNRAPGCFVTGFVPGAYPELEALESEPP
jgi:hypothetical protein